MTSPDERDDLQFERAEYGAIRTDERERENERKRAANEAAYDARVSPAPAARCHDCGATLVDRFWSWQSRVLCEGRSSVVPAIVARSRAPWAVIKAVLLGGGTAVGCGIAYAVFVEVTDYQIAFVTLGIAFLIAKAIRKASSGVSGRRFQVLAVVLTYLAATMGYAPAVLHAFFDPRDGRVAAAPPSTAASGGFAVAPVVAGNGAEKASAAAAPSSSEAPRTQTVEKPSKPTLRSSVAMLLKLSAVFVGLVLASPFLELHDSPIGAFIVLVSLLEAWKLTRPAATVVEGPFRLSGRRGGASGA